MDTSKIKIFDSAQKSKISDTVKGSRDITGEEAKKRQAIKGIIAKTFQVYGFELAETPIIEFEDFVKGENKEDDAVSDIFKLQDKGQRKLALRYEFTFQLKRIAQQKKLPYKRFQIGEVFRDEPASSNRFRQFTQCDADIIGSSVNDEAETLKMVSEILEKLGIKSVVYINSRRLMNEILDEYKIIGKKEVIKEIDKLDKLSEKEVKDNLKKYKAEKIIDIFKKPESFFKKYESYKDIEELEKACKEYNVKIIFLASLARGLSYYNENVFEVKTKEMKETICAGGAYIINNIQAFGFSFGLERLAQLAKIKLEDKRVLIISIGQDKEAIKLTERLRKNNVSCSLFFNKISKALEYANSYKFPYVIFFGEEEKKKRKLKLRDMKTGKEKLVDEKGLIEEFK